MPTNSDRNDNTHVGESESMSTRFSTLAKVSYGLWKAIKFSCLKCFFQCGIDHWNSGKVLKLFVMTRKNLCSRKWLWGSLIVMQLMIKKVLHGEHWEIVDLSLYIIILSCYGNNLVPINSCLKSVLVLGFRLQLSAE